MESQWFWKSGNQEQGPLTTAQLEALVRQHRLHDGDVVRMAESEEWMPASEIREMFLSSSGADTTSASAARALAENRRAQLNRAAQAVEEPPGFFGTIAAGIGSFFHGIFWHCGNLLSIIFGWLPFGGGSKSHSGVSSGGVISASSEVAADVLRTQVSVAPLWHYKGRIIAVLLLIAAIWGLKEFYFGDFANQRAYEKLTTVWSQFEQYEGNIPKDVREQTLAQIDDLKASLEARAAQDPKHKSGFRSEEAFRAAVARGNLLKCCEILHEILSQEKPAWELNRSFISQLNFATQHLATNRDSQQAWLASIDPAIAGFVIMDILVIGGGLWWWKRSGK